MKLLLAFAVALAVTTSAFAQTSPRGIDWTRPVTGVDHPALPAAREDHALVVEVMPVLSGDASAIPPPPLPCEQPVKKAPAGPPKPEPCPLPPPR